MLTCYDTLLRIELAAVRAWPAAESAGLAGWLWRYSGGGSQRANSVSPIAFSGSDVEAAISEAERRYRRRGATPMFQISNVTQPADLDARLQARGYRLKEPCACLAKAIAEAPMPTGVEIADKVTDAWLDVYLAGITPSRRPQAPAILRRVPAPCAFLLLQRDGQPASVALAVAADGVVVAECVATRLEHRRAGASERVMRALEAWGAANGAQVAALQAVTANAPAQALYAKLDYRRVGGYHYRVLDS